jgi:PKD repeat protein
VDFLQFVRCRLRENQGAAVVGPGAYHAGVTPGEYQALEWIDCTVEGNGDDTLPPAKPFPQPAPTASFTVSAEPRVGQSVTFTNTSQAAAGKIAAVLWDLGDGPPSTEPVAIHTYDRPGEYRVTLVVWDEAGRGARCEQRIRVEKGADSPDQ